MCNPKYHDGGGAEAEAAIAACAFILPWQSGSTYTPNTTRNAMVIAAPSSSSSLTHAPAKASSVRALTTEPLATDILCGKTKQCTEHEGSRRFRVVIECFRAKYLEALTKCDKTNCTKEVYEVLQRAGSRFLKYNEGLKVWEEISPTAAREKIGTLFLWWIYSSMIVKEMGF